MLEGRRRNPNRLSWLICPIRDWDIRTALCKYRSWLLWPNIYAPWKENRKALRCAFYVLDYAGGTPWNSSLVRPKHCACIAVSFVTESISMRLHLPFTRHRWRLLSKPCRFETGTKSGAFSKRCGFICRVNSETASIWIRLLFWREICIVQFKIVNLTRSAAFAYTFTTGFSGENGSV